MGRVETVSDAPGRNADLTTVWVVNPTVDHSRRLAPRDTARGMSQQNVEIVRAAVHALDAGEDRVVQPALEAAGLRNRGSG